LDILEDMERIMYKIKEAKEKECRQAFNFWESEYDSGFQFPKCLADGCVHWRWDKNSLKLKGYCGLAGKP
jgi:hypothetical protein